MIINVLNQNWGKDEQGKLRTFTEKNGQKIWEQELKPSDYAPDEDTRHIISMILDSFRWADVIMRKPRREYNDLSTLTRAMYDQMAFNIYQANNGQGLEGDVSQNWKSNAVRPIVRNKVISIAAHATARLLFPKVFAYNEQSEEQEDAAQVMRDLIEWASIQNDYDRQTLFAVISACVNPISITHTEYCENYRTIKTEKGEDGKWKVEEILDEETSGFQLTPVPIDELYVADFYTEDIQKQPYLIWRRVQDYATMKAKYGNCENFKYVKQGIQVIYNDANVGFYEVYDSNLRSELCEELIFYCKSLDLQLALVNGVMMTECDNPNPRLDKNYPFIAFGYEPFDEGRSFYKKSLAFKMQPDADIVNTLYPLIIDGTYLNIFSPMIVAGEESIGADVMIPGSMTTLINPEAAVTPLRVAQDIRQGMETLFKVEESINQSSQEPVMQGATQPGQQTAYEISKLEQNAQTVLGVFLKMIGSYVKQYGKLLMSDILQYLTIPDVNKIIDNGELIYKTFVVHDKEVEGGRKNRKIKFDINQPEEVDDEEEMEKSYDIWEEEIDAEEKVQIYKANPKLFRNLKYQVAISPDILSPMSDDLERAFGLETFDKSIQAAQIGVPVDMEEAFKDFVLCNNPKAKKDINKYIKKEEMPLDINAQMNAQMPGQQGMPQEQPQGQIQQAGQSPMKQALNNNLITK